MSAWFLEDLSFQYLALDLAQLFDIWSHRNLIAAGPLHAKWDRLGSVMLAPGFDWAKAKHSVATVMRGRVQ